MKNEITVVKSTSVKIEHGFTSFICAYKVMAPSEAEHEEFIAQMEILSSICKDAKTTDFGFGDKLSVREWLEHEIGKGETNKSVPVIKHFVGNFYDPTHGLHSVYATATGIEEFIHLSTASQQEHNGGILLTHYLFGQEEAVAQIAGEMAALDAGMKKVFMPLLKSKEVEIA